MHIDQFDRLMRQWMAIDELAGVDNALNGLQVASDRPEIKRAAFAVDASLESFRRAADWKADLLFVHHGLFWGADLPVTGGHYRRLRLLIERGLALYAVHLPLDMQPEFGNNAGIARLLGVGSLQPFGTYRGRKIGFKGELEAPKSLPEIADLLCGGQQHALGILPFGPQTIHSVGIVSGGAALEALEAIAEGLDLYITGDASHAIYHRSLEAPINVIFGGHYLTEQWGVKLLAEKLRAEQGLETMFLDIPTGL
jgi:dinuclear metal center YbgI/SA1388 family protein